MVPNKLILKSGTKIPFYQMELNFTYESNKCLYNIYSVRYSDIVFVVFFYGSSCCVSELDENNVHIRVVDNVSRHRRPQVTDTDNVHIIRLVVL